MGQVEVGPVEDDETAIPFGLDLYSRQAQAGKKRARSFTQQNSDRNIELLKKGKKKHEKKSLKRPPTMELVPKGTKIKYRLIRDLALFALGAIDDSPGFVELTNRFAITKVVVLTVNGMKLDQLGYATIPTEFKVFCVNGAEAPQTADQEEKDVIFSTKLNQFVPFLYPSTGEKLLPSCDSFKNRKFTAREKKDHLAKLADQKVYLPDLLMPLPQLEFYEYPIHPRTVGLEPQEEPTAAQDDGWVNTVEFEHGGSHTFAVDCEMCETVNGKVLTRISVVDFNEQIIMDELVKPEEEITDYLTEYSGITSEMLSNVSTTLRDIQAKLLKLISCNDILIGHSIDNDLKVLKLRHPKIIDTALIYEHPRGPPFKSSLKRLVNDYMGKTIQDGSHDSVIDAVSCLELVKLKLVNDPSFGRLNNSTTIFELCGLVDKNAKVVGSRAASEDDKVERIVDSIRDNELVVCELDSHGVPLDAISKRVATVYDALPGNSLFMVLTGPGESDGIDALNQRKREFKQQYNSKPYEEVTAEWTNTDQQELKSKVSEAARGAAFLSLKN